MNLSRIYSGSSAPWRVVALALNFVCSPVLALFIAIPVKGIIIASVLYVLITSVSIGVFSLILFLLIKKQAITRDDVFGLFVIPVCISTLAAPITFSGLVMFTYFLQCQFGPC